MLRLKSLIFLMICVEFFCGIGCADTIGLWSMDPLSGNPVVNDSSGNGSHLWYMGTEGYTTSDQTPPSDMFNEGFSGGGYSYDSSAQSGYGILFFPPSQYGNVLDFSGSFTVEGFFRTNGEQSLAGPMQVFLQADSDFSYSLVLNENGNGALNFNINMIPGGIQSVPLNSRNYADGNWHYFVIRYIKDSGRLIFGVLNPDGSYDTNMKQFYTGSRLNLGSDESMFIGRETSGGSRTFRGLIDELRFSEVALTDEQLLGDLPNKNTASRPSPADYKKEVWINPSLQWAPAPGAEEHRVYLGSEFPLTFRSEQEGVSYLPGGLEAGRTYYWRIDEVFGEEVVSGKTWRFSTVNPTCKFPSVHDENADCYVDFADFTGFTEFWLQGVDITPYKQAAEYNDAQVVLDFEEGQGYQTNDMESGAMLGINSPFYDPEWEDGAYGKALRFDGGTNWITKSIPQDKLPSEELTVECWAALESYPVDDAAFVNHYTAPSAGYFFGITKFGRWNLSVSVDGNWHTCWATMELPKYKWNHIAATFHKDQGIKLYLNGRLVGTAASPAGRPLTPDTETDLMIGRDIHTQWSGPYAHGAVNGIMDELRVYNKALSRKQIRAEYAKALPLDNKPDLIPSKERFITDSNARPGYHAGTSANWTNEPTGLVYDPDRQEWHVFHQKNPSGSFWDHIHWGHLKSSDLADWDHMPNAIAPEPGIDSGGCWSGNAVYDNGIPTLVYTAIEGKAHVALATSVDGWKTWQKQGHVLSDVPPGYMDYRDPYVWRGNDLWYMVIGSGVDGAGGAALLYKSANLRDWQFLHPLHTGNISSSGHYWEMPVFLPIGNGKHILLITTMESDGPARELYWIGKWENEHFTPDHPEPRQLDIFNWMLAPAAYTAPDGLPRIMGIVPEQRCAALIENAGWRHTFSLPRKIYAASDGTLRQKPAPEIANLREYHFELEDKELATGIGEENLRPVYGKMVEIKAEIEPQDAAIVGVKVLRSPDGAEETLIYYDRLAGTVNIDKRNSTLDKTGSETNLLSAGFDIAGEPVKFHIFVDHSILDVFINDRAVFSTRVYPTRADSTGVQLYSISGTAHINYLDAYKLRSVWEDED
ncbi:Sucrose-6-phosphate hydrolase [Sedimentisphaera cyanobacteriorum]|uniref:beta-fructofuranosidase n=1 Tax=Sedimentisphaera cyanobacteriorum TaxID=1940790 RepID=A0A1Q2HPW7_9BACT|nr:LamG-like jellyroll fold domain-containing protein [Sedimentisphaera cyanobacteriorum]AQQ09283.1 Sucrose-6-phosphate hydrolase [Sedimentisphaera cyanobacteriorum]